MKAIAWEDTLHILAEGDSIQISEDGIDILTATGKRIGIPIDHDKEVRDRLEKDANFKKMIKPILGNMISQLLTSNELHVLDLRGSLIKTKIEIVDPPVDAQQKLPIDEKPTVDEGKNAEG